MIPQLMSVWPGGNKPGLGRGGWHSAHLSAEVIAGMWAEAAARCLLANGQGQNRERLLVWGLDGKSGTFPKPETHLEVISNTASLPQPSKHVWRTVFSHRVQEHVIFDPKICFRREKK